MNPEVLRICRRVKDAGGRALLVGGSVRDLLKGVEHKDLDLEVFGIPAERLFDLLSEIGTVNTVGEHFAVYKLVFPDNRDGQASGPKQFEIDVSIPRRESKSGRGHRGFLIQGDPFMSTEEAARRRDFTINAILLDPLTGEYIDHFGGIDDLDNGRLRAVTAETFAEDSLRVLRAVQLAARYGLTLDPATAELCRSIDLSDLPRERIWGEIEKLLLMAERPSTGLDVALELAVLDRLLPELKALVGCPLSTDLPIDAFEHTKRCLDEAAALSKRLEPRRGRKVAVLMAALCHELGWASGSTRTRPGRDEALASTRAVLQRLGLQRLDGYDVRHQVLALVAECLTPFELFDSNGGDADLRRLSLRVDVSLLGVLARAESAALGGAGAEAARWFNDRVGELGLEEGPPPRLLLGRHLLELGVEPGPRMGEILDAIYEQQLDGLVRTHQEALAAARTLLSRNLIH